MIKSLWLVGFVAWLTIPFLLGVQEQEQEQEKSVTQQKFMQRKLDFSKEVVAGLATEDFERIAKGAQDLMLLSNESNWNSVNSRAYLKASSDFRETVQRLRSASRENNLDAATLAYFEVTINCVRCHKQLRKGIKRQKSNF